MTEQPYKSFKSSMKQKNLVFCSEPVELEPYDFHVHLGYGKSKIGLAWDIEMYTNLLKIIKENKLYQNLNGKFIFKFNDEDEETISTIASLLYTSGGIQKKVRTLTAFFQMHSASIQQDFDDYMCEKHTIKPLQKKIFDTFIDDLAEMFLTNQNISDGVIDYIFHDSEITLGMRKVILTQLFGQQSQDRDNVNKYERAIRNFKHSIINTIQLKLAQHGDQIETHCDHYIMESEENLVPPRKPSKLEDLVIADAIATAITIDPALLVTSHKMHYDIHFAFKRYEQTLKFLIYDFTKSHLTLNQCIDSMLNLIRDELISIHINKKQTQLLLELITDYLHGLKKEAKFTFERCNRYANDIGDGIKVIANYPIHKGEVIHRLSGKVVKIPQQELERDHSLYDFSIMLNGREEEMIYLGPGSFLNHDCNPNAEYIAKENKNIAIKTLRYIKEGEEINVFYRENYFGKGNMDCKCRTCEMNYKGGFAKRKRQKTP
ncbi:hypothetical protein QAD02_023461 [Eretmocerus hayati]|uniref:Uncharacterized protein n=1 Tax=Eretmocerus hayati TaxID=131215 RepID=A0ACC2PW30_9HYME|nr:hypothetical protein QAD02_023461 [Eretmocerus hayati]